jgi:putative peptidoglycan lipid II flippase
MGVAVVFLGFTAGCTSLLEAHHNFLVPGFSRVIYGMVVIVALVTLSSRMGVMAIAWGVVVAATIRLLVQWANVWRLGGIRLTRNLDNPGVRKGFRLIIPVVIGLAGIQVTFLLDNMVVSLLPDGALAGLAYAIRVVMLPVGLVALPLRTTIFPTLSYQAASGQVKGLGVNVSAGIRYLLFIIIPISAGILILREPLVHLLFERGSFDSAATSMTSSAMGFYALGVPAIAGLTLISNVYFSLDGSVALVKIFLLNWISNLILNLALFSPLGHIGIALATSLSTTATFVVAVMGLKKRLPAFELWSLVRDLIKVVLATAGMIAAIWGSCILLSISLNGIMISSALEALITVLVGGLVGAATYAVGSLVLRLDEMRALFRVVLRKVH